MDLKTLLAPVMRLLGRAALDTALRHGPGLLGGRGRSGAPVTAADRARERQARALVKKARQAARLTRRR